MENMLSVVLAIANITGRINSRTAVFVLTRLCSGLTERGPADEQLKGVSPTGGGSMILICLAPDENQKPFSWDLGSGLGQLNRWFGCLGCWRPDPPSFSGFVACCHPPCGVTDRYENTAL